MPRSNTFNDLKGQQFEDLLVVEYVGGKDAPWRCLCKCGKEYTVPGAALRRKSAKRCPDCTILKRSIDLTGATSGLLTYVRDVGMVTRSDNNKWNDRLIECICACGSSHRLKAQNFISQQTKSCGCLQSLISQSTRRTNREKFEAELLGRRFGRWTVICWMPTPKGLKGRYADMHWKCCCDCGNQGIIRGHTLRTGESQSCGCLRAELMSQRMKTRQC